MTDNDKDKYENIYLKTGKVFRVSDESVYRMNDGIIDTINSIAGESDLVCCGDWVFGSKKSYSSNAREVRDRLRAKNVDLIIGNHDIPSQIRGLFRFCAPMAEVTIEDQGFMLCHYPMVAWNGSHRKKIMVHGHVHNLYSKPGHPHPLARPELWCAFDVGVDTNDYKPYSVPQLKEMAKPVWEAQERARRENKEHHLF